LGLGLGLVCIRWPRDTLFGLRSHHIAIPLPPHLLSLDWLQIQKIEVVGVKTLAARRKFLHCPFVSWVRKLCVSGPQHFLVIAGLNLSYTVKFSRFLTSNQVSKVSVIDQVHTWPASWQIHYLHDSMGQNWLCVHACVTLVVPCMSQL